MNTKYTWGIIIAIIVVAGGSFYGGMAYAQSVRQATRTGNPNAQFMAAGGGIGGTRTAFRSAGATAGEIIAKDATSVTVKMQDGSTKIILTPSGTEVMKSVAGTAADLSLGTNVSVIGTANSDGSVTAQNVQIRPQGTRLPSQGVSSPGMNPGQ